MTLVLACKTFKAAPVPRPPQPTTPTRMGSGAARPYRTLTNGKGIAVASKIRRCLWFTSNRTEEKGRVSYHHIAIRSVL